MIIYEYAIPTPTNLENLDIEIAASPLSGYVSPTSIVGEMMQIKFDDVLSDVDKGALDLIISGHNGNESRTSESLERKREAILRKLVNMAHIHPILKQEDITNSPAHTGEDVITSYLTSIDNWFNSWKRDGNHKVLVAKISSDAVTGDYVGFLNTVVNQVEIEGATINVTTAQFLISLIPTTPYI